MEDIWDIIEELSPIEIKIMKIMAKYASVHKNVRLETVQKKLLPKERNHVGKIMQKLIAKGLVLPYRNKNYGLTKTGKKIGLEIYEQEKRELYPFKIE